LHIPNLFTNTVNFTTKSFDLPILAQIPSLLKEQTVQGTKYMYLEIISQSQIDEYNQIFLDISFNNMCQFFGNQITKQSIPNFDNIIGSYDDNFAEQGTLIFPDSQYLLMYGGLHYDYQDVSNATIKTINQCALPDRKKILTQCNKTLLNESFEDLNFLSNLDKFANCLSSDLLLIQNQSKIITKLEVDNLHSRMLHCGCIREMTDQSTDSNLVKYVGRCLLII
jgi:hypothetical protein